MDLFVYGTLQNLKLMQAASGQVLLDPKPATLRDHAVRPVAQNVVPFITPAKGEAASGILFTGLDAAAQARLDLYEGAFGYVLQPHRVETSDGPVTAQVYMPPPDIPEGPGDWSLAAWEEDHLAPALFAVAEVFAHDPLPDQATLRRMWPMIEMRAWARHRAQTIDIGPATLRHAAKAGDVTTLNQDPPYGQFFRFRGLDVDHQRFDGSRSPRLRREVFDGVDAVLLLPYDAKRDRVLLVEQMRMGAAVRGDLNPWVLEPIAGMIDARETPEATALREAKEEAGLTDLRLEKINAFYPSPGSSTDYFHSYLGHCDLPDSDQHTGGLDTEGEDLRLHTITFDHAMALAESGEITAGPLMMMLYWLAGQRARLRGAG